MGTPDEMSVAKVRAKRERATFLNSGPKTGTFRNSQANCRRPIEVFQSRLQSGVLEDVGNQTDVEALLADDFERRFERSGNDDCGPVLIIMKHGYRQLFV